MSTAMQDTDSLSTGAGAPLTRSSSNGSVAKHVISSIEGVTSSMSNTSTILTIDVPSTPISTSTTNCNPGKITAVFGEITISSNFDSGNLAKVEECKSADVHEFNLWTSPDCAESEFENGNKTWFYFSVCTPPNSFGNLLRFNVQNLNRQSRLYQQGLSPITKSIPGRGGWERLRGRTEYENTDEGLRISFDFTVSDSRKLTTYFAFCYPYSYSESQRRLAKLDEQFRDTALKTNPETHDRIYYYRELLCHSLEGRRIDLITVTSWDGISEEREPYLPHLFPDRALERCPIFKEKKVIVISSRVHPGETPSSHVFNGLLQFLLRPNDLRAVAVRRKFVFKLIPMLNPDGVYRGHYRTDTRGANLNRYYLNPDPDLHPSIYAARSLVLYYHCGGVATNISADSKSVTCSGSDRNISTHAESSLSTGTESSHQGLDSCSNTAPEVSATIHVAASDTSASILRSQSSKSLLSCDALAVSEESGVGLYVDLHAHAAKRGVFMYGNYFSNVAEQAENMLFPKLISLNSPHLDFEHCVFSEKNMYSSDKRDGLTKEGSGRVGIYKATRIIPCYTLECNYNSGRQKNALTEATMDNGRASPSGSLSPMAHRFSIADFEQVGRAIAVSVLDLHQLNPWTRIPTTTYGSVAGVRQTLIQRLQNLRSKKMLKYAQDVTVPASDITAVENISDSGNSSLYKGASSISSSRYPSSSKHRLSGLSRGPGKVSGISEAMQRNATRGSGSKNGRRNGHRQEEKSLPTKVNINNGNKLLPISTVISSDGHITDSKKTDSPINKNGASFDTTHTTVDPTNTINIEAPNLVSTQDMKKFPRSVVYTNTHLRRNSSTSPLPVYHKGASSRISGEVKCRAKPGRSVERRTIASTGSTLPSESLSIRPPRHDAGSLQRLKQERSLIPAIVTANTDGRRKKIMLSQRTHSQHHTNNCGETLISKSATNKTVH